MEPTSLDIIIVRVLVGLGIIIWAYVVTRDAITWYRGFDFSDRSERMERE
jgi:hypothetical protein